MQKRVYAIVAIGVALVAFFALNMLASVAMRWLRVDLTSDRLYTLPAGAKAIARGIDEPIRARFYFSRELASGNAALTAYARRVEDTLREFASVSGGKFVVEVIEPEAFSQEEDEAAALGVAGQPVGGGERLFFGLVMTNAVDGKEVIPFLDPGQERLLMYEVAHRVHLLSSAERAKVGVMSALTVEGAEPDPMGRTPPQRPWVVYEELSRQYEVVSIDPLDVSGIADVDVLVVIHPQNFSAGAWYAIDQFVMRGGRVVFAVDPHCESFVPPEARADQMALYTADRSSGLGALGRAWGVEVVAGIVAGDQGNAISVSAPGAEGMALSYVPYMTLREDRLSSDDVVTSSVGLVTYQAGGVIERAADSSVTMTPLLKTGLESMKIRVERVKFPSPQDLIRDFVPSGEELVLAARVSGRAKSAFADGAPAGVEAGGEHVAESVGEINVIVFADADMFSDAAWVRPMGFGNTVIGYQRFADNGSLMLNAVESLAGSSELISIRPSSTAFRPFTRVLELQKAAETEYLAEEKRYMDELRQTEQRINELLRSAGGDESVILSDEVKREVESLRQREAETRLELRRVRHGLNKDVERLGLQLKLINIGLIPAVVAVAAVGLGGWRAARRRRDRMSAREGGR